MQPDLEQTVARMKSSWMVGGSALGHAPTAWASIAERAPDAELALLALSGHLIGTCFAPVASGLTARADIPTLSLPPLPDRLRPLFRRALAQLGPDAARRSDLLQLIANRGWTVHPMDWFPTMTADVPDLYAPWKDWSARAERHGRSGRPTSETLTADTWDDWMPAERLAQLRDMRGTDADLARSIVAAKAASESAEKRLAIVDTLSVGLSDDDTDYLRALSGDRSGKVRARAAQLLARLGGTGEGSDARELADFLVLSKPKLLSRKRKLTVRSLKTKAQRARLLELFETVPLSALAAALDLDPASAVSSWSVGNPEAATEGFAQMVAQTGSDSDVEALAEVLKGRNVSASSLAALMPRLDADWRMALLLDMVQRSDDQFRKAADCASDSLGTMPLDVIADAPGYRAFLAAAKAVAKDAADIRQTRIAAQSAINLGLLCDAAAAGALRDTTAKLGLTTPALCTDILAFNAALAAPTQGPAS